MSALSMFCPIPWTTKTRWPIGGRQSVSDDGSLYPRTRRLVPKVWLRPVTFSPTVLKSLAVMPCLSFIMSFSPTQSASYPSRESLWRTTVGSHINKLHTPKKLILLFYAYNTYLQYYIKSGVSYAAFSCIMLFWTFPPKMFQFVPFFPPLHSPPFSIMPIWHAFLCINLLLHSYTCTWLKLTMTVHLSCHRLWNEMKTNL